MARKFKWMAWDFDCEGEAYVIAQDECSKEDVPDYIVREDCLHEDCKSGMVIEEGVCKYMVRSDWNDFEGEAIGGYYVRQGQFDISGCPGWFRVWIVRKGDWY